MLVAWIGNTDLRYAGCLKNRSATPDIGPIARALGHRPYSSICLLNDVKPGEREGDDLEKGRCYRAWLDGCGDGIPDHEVMDVTILGATHMDSIYNKAREVLDRVLPFARGASVEFLLSSGTPAMGSVWVLLAGRYGARLVESSREQGIRDVVVPLADYETMLLPGVRGYRHITGQDEEAPSFLLTWLGGSDHGAPGGDRPGPVASYLEQRFRLHKHCYEKVFVLYEENDSARDASGRYCQWLQDRLGSETKVIQRPVHLEAKTLLAIHAATQKVVWRLRDEEGDPALDFLVSPGLSHMRIAWMLVWIGYPQAVLWETWVDPKTRREEITQVALPLVGWG